MLEQLLNLDTQFFLLINHGLANPFFDTVMPFITSVKNWYAVYVAGLLLLLWRGAGSGRRCAVLLMLTVLITDPLTSRIIKQLVNRTRPSSVVANARVLVTNVGGKSFPSSHAANNFAAALILVFFYRKRAWLWYSIAVVIGFSRVYAGVHYPLDILGGAIEGSCIAAIVLYLFAVIVKQYSKFQNKKAAN